VLRMSDKSDSSSSDDDKKSGKRRKSEKKSVKRKEESENEEEQHQNGDEDKIKEPTPKKKPKIGTIFTATLTSIAQVVCHYFCFRSAVPTSFSRQLAQC
jgi:hypothetical protein